MPLGTQNNWLGLGGYWTSTRGMPFCLYHSAWKTKVYISISKPAVALSRSFSRPLNGPTDCTRAVGKRLSFKERITPLGTISEGWRKRRRNVNERENRVSQSELSCSLSTVRCGWVLNYILQNIRVKLKNRPPNYFKSYPNPRTQIPNSPPFIIIIIMSFYHTLKFRTGCFFLHLKIWCGYWKKENFKEFSMPNDIQRVGIIFRSFSLPPVF